MLLSNRRINKTKACGSEKLGFYCRMTSPGRGKLRLLLYQGIIVGIQMKLEVNKNFEHLQRDSPICHLYTLFASARILCNQLAYTNFGWGEAQTRCFVRDVQMASM